MTTTPQKKNNAHDIQKKKKFCIILPQRENYRLHHFSRYIPTYLNQYCFVKAIVYLRKDKSMFTPKNASITLVNNTRVHIFYAFLSLTGTQSANFF